MGITGIAWFEIHYCSTSAVLCDNICPLVPAIGSLFMCVSPPLPLSCAPYLFAFP